MIDKQTLEKTLNHIIEGPPSILKTSFQELDNILAGVDYGNIITISGRPSMGKTTLLLCIMNDLLICNKFIQIFKLLQGSIVKTSIRVKSTSFEINKLITTTQLFSQVKLSISARLVLRCIVDYWNFKLCCAYPTQATIAKCTGLTEVAVLKAVKELDTKGLVEKRKKRKRIYYHFTLKFLGYLNLLPKVIYVDTQKKLGKMPKQCLDKNILKENENTLFSNLLNEENEDCEEDDDGGLALAKATIKHLSNNPLFANKIRELKERYNL